MSGGTNRLLPAYTGPLVANQAVTVVQRRLSAQRIEPIGTCTVMHEHNGFARAADLVLEFKTIHVARIMCPYGSSLQRNASVAAAIPCSPHIE